MIGIMTRKPGRLMRFLKGLAAAVILLVILFVVIAGPWPIDRTQPGEAAWFKTSLESVGRTLAERTEVAGIRVGIAAIPLELPKGLPLAGYGARKGAASTGTHDPIRAKAIAFSAGDRTGVIAGADILLINEALASSVAQRVSSRLGRDQIYFMATHTHSGPGGWGNWWAENLVAGAPSSEGMSVLAEGMASAIEAALANLEVATLSYGKAVVPEHIRNRLLGADSPVDPSLQVVKITGRGGKSLGALVSYAAHPTVLDDDNLLFSAEYPGVLERSLESLWGGTVVFCAGPVGSMSTKGGEGQGFDRIKSIGESLAAKAEALAAGGGLKSITGTFPFQFERVAIVSPPLQYCPTAKLRVSPILSRFGFEFNRAVSISVLRIGPLLAVGVPCELSGEIADALYPFAAERGLHLILTPFNGHYQGYVVPDKYFPLDKYETRAMRFLGPHAGDYFERVLREIIEKEAAV
jgi:hypothetical protein